MKRVINTLKIIGTSVFVSVFILFLTKGNYFSCPALEVFLNESFFSLIIESVKILLITVGIWFLGLILFLRFRNKKRLNVYIYFIIITTIAFIPLIHNAIKRSPEKNRLIKEGICNKGNDDGMQLTFKQLSKKEYNFIHSGANWLPSIPNETKNINIDYYRDGFLGDFDLRIELELKDNKTIDLVKFPEWIADKGKFYYHSYKD